MEDTSDTKHNNNKIDSILWLYCCDVARDIRFHHAFCRTVFERHWRASSIVYTILCLKQKRKKKAIIKEEQIMNRWVWNRWKWIINDFQIVIEIITHVNNFHCKNLLFILFDSILLSIETKAINKTNAKQMPHQNQNWKWNRKQWNRTKNKKQK